MTRRAKRPCAGSPLCPELVDPPTRYCPDHARRRDQARGTPADRGYDEKWRRFSHAYKDRRAKEHPDGRPRCDHCGRTAEEAGGPLHVDHIDGLGPLGPRGYDETNLQLLCQPDHAAKTALQTGTAGGPT